MIKLLTKIALLSAFCAVVPSAAAAEFYVATDGADTNAGTIDKPFLTLEAARDAVRALRKKEPHAGLVTVRFRGGTYLRDKPFDLDEKDSGQAGAESVYRVFSNETARLMAGRPLKVTDFMPVKDAAMLARLSPEARTNVVFVDLNAMGIAHKGPWPGVFHGGNGGLAELLFKGVRMPLARWPNGTNTTMKSVVDKGLDPGGGKPHGGAFEFRDDRHLAWRVDQGVWLRGYWRVPWEIETVRVASLDASNRIIRLAAPVPGGLGSKYAKANGSGKEPYWVVNQFDEIDQPGEWCIDFNSGRLYFWPPKKLVDGAAVLCDMDGPVISLKNASYVRIADLEFEGGLGNAIEMTNCDSNLVRGCMISNFGKTGVTVRGGRTDGVEDCEILNMGAGGITLSGGDRLSLAPAGHYAVNNHIHHYAQVKLVYAAAIEIAGGSVGMRVANNLIHNSPHVGILYSGNDHVLEYNEIHHVCEVSDDMGGFYTWHDWTSRGNVVRFNYVHDSPLAHGVYCDDGDSGDYIMGNVFYKIDAGVFIGGGHDNIVTNNLAVDCKRALHIDARGTTRGYDLNNKAMVSSVKSVKPDQPPWSQRYPELAKLLDFHPELPTGTAFDCNVMVNCKKGIDRSKNAEELKYTRFSQNLELQEDPGFVDMAKPDFALRKDSPVYRQLPGFAPIPFEKIGFRQR